MVSIQIFGAPLYPNDFEKNPENFMLFGLNLSYQNGFQTGGEISYAHYNEEWIGLYTDFIYNLEQKKWKWSIGPELGWYCLGVDFGFLYKQTSDKIKPGITGRILLSFVLAHLYFRTDYIFKNEKSFEIGLILKLPATLK